MIPIPVPMFSWVSIQQHPQQEPTALLVIHPDIAGPHAQALGARAWRLLEILVWDARPSPAHDMHYTVTTSIPALLSRAQGEDPAGGWGADALRPFIQQMEQVGYYTRTRGRGRGRRQGSEPTTWIMSPRLYLQLPTISTSNNTVTYSTDSYSYVSVPSGHGADSNAVSSVSVSSAAPHENECMTHHAYERSPELAMAIEQVLRDWGWTTNIRQEIEKRTQEWFALWIAEIQDNSKIADPGAFLRSRLQNDIDPPKWNEQFDIGLSEGKIVLNATEQREQSELLSVTELINVLDNLPRDMSDAIREKARQQRPDNRQESPGLIWRRVVSEEIAKITEYQDKELDE